MNTTVDYCQLNKDIEEKYSKLSEEVWFPIPGFDGYSASSLGRVVNQRKGKVLSQSKFWTGYLSVCLPIDKKFKRHSVHRIILKTFSGFDGEGLCCCHRDGNRTNNKIANLKWGTHKENEEDRKMHGTNKCNIGSKNPNSKLDELDAIIIKSLSKCGLHHKFIAKLFGVSGGTAYDIVFPKINAWSHIDKYIEPDIEAA